MSAVKFTRTPVPRYDGISDWDQYREVYEAIVISNGWDDLTAALQLLAHLMVRPLMWLYWYRRPTSTPGDVDRIIDGTLHFSGEVVTTETSV